MNRHLPAVVPIAVTAVLLATATVVGQDSSNDELPAAGEPLVAGRYVDSSLGPTIEFRVSEGWVAGPDVDAPIITLESALVPGGVMTITRFDGDAFAESCDATSLITVDPSVRRVAEIIGANPLLRVAPPVVTAVDGSRGIQLDVGVPAFEDCAVPFLLLWAVPDMEDGEFVQVANQQSRFIIVDADGTVVVIAIEAFPGVPFGRHLDASMEVVDSMRIIPLSEPAVSPSPSPAPTEAPEASVEPVVTPSPTPAVIRTPTPLATDPPDA